MEADSPNDVVKILPVSYSRILGDPDAEKLLGEYAAECSIPDIGPTNPQSASYHAMEASGMMTTFGAYKGDFLVGFAAILLYVLPHYGKKVATLESLFVAAEHRGAVSRPLMGTIEQHAKNEGCEVMLYSAPTGSRFERLLQLLPAYRHTNSIFLRKLQ